MRVPLLLLLGGLVAYSAYGRSSLYEHSVRGPDGESFSLAQYQSKPVVLVVNVASRCGFTDSNYKQLQTLYEKVGRHRLSRIESRPVV